MPGLAVPTVAKSPSFALSYAQANGGSAGIGLVPMRLESGDQSETCLRLGGRAGGWGDWARWDWGTTTSRTRGWRLWPNRGPPVHRCSQGGSSALLLGSVPRRRRPRLPCPHHQSRPAGACSTMAARGRGGEIMVLLHRAVCSIEFLV